MKEISPDQEARFATLAQGLVAESPVDPERVRTLAEEIRAGTYHSDPWRIAKRLIEFELLRP